jgi:hypothetical protein
MCAEQQVALTLNFTVYGGETMIFSVSGGCFCLYVYSMWGYEMVSLQNPIMTVQTHCTGGYFSDFVFLILHKFIIILYIV